MLICRFVASIFRDRLEDSHTLRVITSRALQRVRLTERHAMSFDPDLAGTLQLFISSVTLEANTSIVASHIIAGPPSAHRSYMLSTTACRCSEKPLWIESALYLQPSSSTAAIDTPRSSSVYERSLTSSGLSLYLQFTSTPMRTFLAPPSAAPVARSPPCFFASPPPTRRTCNSGAAFALPPRVVFGLDLVQFLHFVLDSSFLIDTPTFPLSTLPFFLLPPYVSVAYPPYPSRLPSTHIDRFLSCTPLFSLGVVYYSHLRQRTYSPSIHPVIIIYTSSHISSLRLAHPRPSLARQRCNDIYMLIIPPLLLASTPLSTPPCLADAAVAGTSLKRQASPSTSCVIIDIGVVPSAQSCHTPRRRHIAFTPHLDVRLYRRR
ncbi:hypothetical protein R3P38DRAFT_3231002 [Favolaschia claudopus]|uniref:Uncharacterized protein n=1 Tax=Favolaschia claudopus TaxID=2862362 RepID=A0AAV9ZL50_9AGAR